MNRTVAWFSCGSSSAVMTKIALLDNPETIPVYCDVGSEHPDNKRFLKDCENWFEKKILVLKSSKYKNVNDVIMKKKYMSGIKGAPCAVELKKVPRFDFQRVDDLQLFGYTLEEKKRADRFLNNNLELNLFFPLIYNSLKRRDCLSILLKAGIKLPLMYGLGFSHNNCLGCVKSSSPSYWFRTRLHFPAVFAERVRQSRSLNVKLLKIKGTRFSLDELPDVPVLKYEREEPCDFFCQSIYNEKISK